MNDIFIANVTKYDSKTHLATIQFLNPNNDEYVTLENVGISSSYAHPLEGQSVCVAPEIGSQCIICKPPLSSEYQILGFINITEQDYGNRDGKPELSSGDIYLATAPFNWIILRKSGLLEISAGINKLIMIDTGNLIQFFGGNFQAVNTAGHTITWYDNDGKSITKISLGNITVSLGNVTDGFHFGDFENVIESNSICLDISAGPDTIFGLRLDESGNVSIKTSKFGISADDSIELNSKSQTLIMGNPVDIKDISKLTSINVSSSGVTISAPSINFEVPCVGPPGMLVNGTLLYKIIESIIQAFGAVTPSDPVTLTTAINQITGLLPTLNYQNIKISPKT
jgi:hypothetical protein